MKWRVPLGLMNSILAFCISLMLPSVVWAGASDYCSNASVSLPYEYRQDFIRSCITSARASEKLISSSSYKSQEERTKDYCNEMASTVSYEYRQDFIRNCTTSALK